MLLEKKNWVQCHANLAGIPQVEQNRCWEASLYKQLMELSHGYWVKSEQGSERNDGENNGLVSGTLKIQDPLHQ